MTIPSDDLTAPGVTPGTAAGPTPATGATPATDAGATPGTAAGATPATEDRRSGRSGTPGADHNGIRGVARAELVTVLMGLAGGVALGGAWRVLAPLMARWTGGVEDAAAHDVAFGLLAILAGLITAVAVMFWPGGHPAVHAAVVLSAVTVASLLAWAVGWALHGPTLHAVAVVVVWPLVAAVITTVRNLVSVLVGPS